MRRPMTYALEGMVDHLRTALEHHRVELSVHQGKSINSLEVLSVRLVGDKGVEVTHKRGKLLIQSICRLEDWPADTKTLRSYALQSRVQPSIACFYVHFAPPEAGVELPPSDPEPVLLPAIT